MNKLVSIALKAYTSLFLTKILTSDTKKSVSFLGNPKYCLNDIDGSPLSHTKNKQTNKHKGPYSQTHSGIKMLIEIRVKKCLKQNRYIII